MNIPQDFSLDAQSLTKRFRQMQSIVHPDKFSNKYVECVFVSNVMNVFKCRKIILGLPVNKTIQQIGVL